LLFGFREMARYALFGGIRAGAAHRDQGPSALPLLHAAIMLKKEKVMTRCGFIGS
jgi:hypothetical protein